MKKVFSVLLITLFAFPAALCAQGVHFTTHKSWSDVLAQAKKENKLIFLDAYAVWCGPCKYMQNDVFPLERVGKFFNANFINVKMDMEKGEGVALAEKLGLTAYPTLYFINGDGEPVHRYVGALEEAEFVSLGKDALNPDKQFYTAKKRAREGKMTPDTFHSWIHNAGKDEDDAEEIINSYLAATTAPLTDRELLYIILDHTTVLPQKYLDYLHRNTAQVAQLLVKEEEYVQAVFAKKVKAYAVNATASETSMDFARYEKIMAQYGTGNARLEGHKIKVKYYCYKKDYAEGLKALATCIDERSLGLGADDLAELMVAYAPVIIASGRGEAFLKKIAAYKLLPADKNKAYNKNLALLALYVHMGDKAMAAQTAESIRTDDFNTDEVLGITSELLELLEKK
jgi:thiol-disulfide isomerase/thioredoxin